MRKAKVVYHVSDIEARAPANLISVIVVYHVSDIEERVERPRTRRPVVYHVSDIEGTTHLVYYKGHRCLSCK